MNKSPRLNVDYNLIDELLITVPAGIVEMRDDRIAKVWKKEIETFNLAKFPVTQDLYEAVTNENPAAFKGDKLPVERVSWIEVVRFCNKLSECLDKDLYYSIDTETKKVAFNKKANGFRLPTEAEWQYACQAGTKSIWHGKLKN